MTTEKKVKVSMVHINKSYNEDYYDCTVKIAAPSGEMSLKLPNDRVNQIVDLVADLVIEATTEAMQSMTSDAMAQTAIEHKPEPEDE